MVKILIIPIMIANKNTKTLESSLQVNFIILDSYMIQKNKQNRQVN